MKVSFDGLRTNATRSMNSLHFVLEKVLQEYKNDFYYNEDEEIIEKFNEAAMFVDTFNCFFDPDVEDDFNNLEELSINRLLCVDDEDE